MKHFNTNIGYLGKGGWGGGGGRSQNSTTKTSDLPSNGVSLPPWLVSGSLWSERETFSVFYWSNLSPITIMHINPTALLGNTTNLNTDHSQSSTLVSRTRKSICTTVTLKNTPKVKLRLASNFAGRRLLDVKSVKQRTCDCFCFADDTCIATSFKNSTYLNLKTKQSTFVRLFHCKSYCSRIINTTGTLVTFSFYNSDLWNLNTFK